MQKICLISFSSRPNGNCGRTAGMLHQKYGERSVLYDFSTFTITPCGRCGYECFQAREDCPYCNDPEYTVCSAIAGSGLACFIVPNYCDYPCANFFAFNERSQCYFQHHPALLTQYLSVKKKFIVISNTGRENFTTAFRYHVAEGVEPDILFLSAKRFHKTSIRGDLMDAPEARAAVLQFMSSAG